MPLEVLVYRNRQGITPIRIFGPKRQLAEAQFYGIPELARVLLATFGRRILISFMSIFNLKSTLKGLALASVFALGVVFASSTSASAQYRQPGYYGNGGYNTGGYNGRDNDRRRKEERKAYEKGFKDGYKDGKRAARDGRWGNRGGNNRGGYGYGGGTYQRGYQEGYREGYDRNRRGGGIFNNRRWPF